MLLDVDDDERTTRLARRDGGRWESGRRVVEVVSEVVGARGVTVR